MAIARRDVSNRIVVLVSAVVIAGCSGETAHDAPGDGYRAFRRAFIDADTAALWTRVDERTRQFFRERHRDLVDMDRDIERYLPQTDQRLARKQSGAVLVDRIEGPRGLFEHVIRPRRVVVDRPRRVGSRIGSVRIGEENRTAVVTTRGGRTFRLVRGEDEKWAVDLIASLEVLPERMAWVESNRRAVAETVESIVDRRQSEREEIIAELMDVE